jgi:hypothetical protein
MRWDRVLTESVLLGLLLCSAPAHQVFFPQDPEPVRGGQEGPGAGCGLHTV